jgi:hypothetical protein
VRAPLAATILVSLASTPMPAGADAVSGVCPDGSIFVVQDEAAIPCARARRVDPADMPPIRPEYLPRPYTWLVDQESRNPNNPYNLVETAAKLRAARAGTLETGGPSENGSASTQGLPVASGASAAPALAPATPPAPLGLGLDEGEATDLARLVLLRQQVAPAEIVVEDIHGAEELRIQLAWSDGLEARVQSALGVPAGEHVVVAFLARTRAPVEFHPNFFAVQGPLTFRPDSARRGELGFVIGEPGAQPEGSVALGWFLLPARFDPAQPIDLWWNDRSVTATLR